MKKINYIIIVALAGITFSSCKKYLDDVKTSPNEPLTASPKVLLSSIEVATFANYTGNNARRSSIFIQQISGTGFQMSDVNNYLVLETDVDNDWQTIYSGAVINAQILIDKYSTGNPYYKGIATVIKAMNIGLATDMWGDVPCKDAAKGLDNLKPAYDAQSSVYADIQTMLSDAITELQKPVSDNKLLPKNEDYIYGGDVSHWIQAAYVLKARYANRLNKRNPSASATDALGFLNEAYNAGFAGNSDDLNAVFGPNGNENNQWANFNATRADYIKLGKFLVDKMNASNDPRLEFYADTVVGGTYVGGDLENPDASSSSDIGIYLDNNTGALPMVSYVEAKFIEAECQLRLGNTSAAAQAHNAAIKASIRAITGAGNTAYEAAHAAETAATISLSKIMNEKYVALYGQVESWTDWRRTGFPALSPNPSAAISGIPHRLPNSRDERNYNPNAPSNFNLLSPLWFE